MITKFRAWDKETNEMNDVLIIDYLNDFIELAYENEERYFVEVELMQSTGLKDKYGVEIYEGDIVEVIISDTEPKIHEDKEILGKIVYKCGSFDVAIEDDKFAGIIPMMHLGDCEFTFIIHGNIYQHPNLLEADSHE